MARGKMLGCLVLMLVACKPDKATYEEMRQTAISYCGKMENIKSVHSYYYREVRVDCVDGRQYWGSPTDVKE